MGKYFGTDGVRGVANDGLDSTLAYRVGVATAMVLARNNGKKPLFTLGKDTRASGDMLEAALTAGICAAGADVIQLGVVPTPAVAFITKSCGADAGIVISASHNPFGDNGIKIFNGEGFKLSDETEGQIEDIIDGALPLELKTGGDIGRVVHKENEYVRNYVEYISSRSEAPIGNLKVIIDCSNGAASRTASDIFDSLPIQLELIKDHPNGVNINDSCGSTHMELLSRMVVAGGYDLGIAFDGDADRCLAVDELGNQIDGDMIMAICGDFLRREGRLKNDTIVSTVMSNLGFYEFCTERGMKIERTNVGDRYVLERMLEKGYSLGGEQSGHIIFLDDATTGDGQLAAVKLISVICASGKKVSELASEIKQYPQILINVPIKGGNPVKEALMNDEQLVAEVAEEKKNIKGRGRILVRPSGTEPLIRVMVEAREQEEAERIAKKLSNSISLRGEEINF